MNMKKLTALFLAAILAAGILASCGNDAGTSSEASSESSVTSELDNESSLESSVESSAEETESSQAEESSQSESAEPSEESSASSEPASKPSNGSSSIPSKPAASKPAESSEQAPPPAQSVNTDDSTAPEGAKVSLSSIISQLYEGIPEADMPMVMEIALTAENSEYYVGVPSSSYTEGLASDSAIGSIAHSVCLLRAKDADAAAALAKDVESKANPAKWICVTAEKMIVKQKGDLVLLIMASSSNADTISANFDNLSV